MNPGILLSEDEPGLVLTLTDRLTREGYQVDSATDGESGQQRALTSPFDLILLDVMLPKKDGFDICRCLHEQGVKTPLLMLTARGQVTDRVAGLKLGAESREELLNEVWGYHSMPSTRTVDVYVAWLRQKLEEKPSHPQYIVTVHRLGYKFVG